VVLYCVAHHAFFPFFAQRARRKASKRAFLRSRQKREQNHGEKAFIASDQEMDLQQQQQQQQQQQPDSDPQSASVSTEEASSAANGPIHFRAHKNGVLDIFTYHRGREGMELRDEDSGELLCDVEPTDTNFSWDEPKMVAMIQFTFPLTENGHEYRETIAWDLGDPDTLTPEAFAINVADEFGLDFACTMDLVVSIQAQLRAFVRENCPYAIPVPLKDGLGQLRETMPPSSSPHLYGQVTGSALGGMDSSAGKTKPPLRTTSGIGLVLVTEKGQNGKAQSKGEKDLGACEEERAERVYRDEVQQRLRLELEREIKNAVNGSGEDSADTCGRIHVKSDAICHLCGAVKTNCESFSCGITGHSYCYDHLLEKLSLDGNGPSPRLDYCPVCSLDCTCSICTQVLDEVALYLKNKSMDQDLSLESTVVHNILVYSRQTALRILEGELKPRPSKKRKKVETLQRPTVRKVPLSDFPREVSSGIDIDPGSFLDYHTVYTSSGFIVPDDSIPGEELNQSILIESKPAVASSEPLVEDGSVDYCHVCLKHGNLLCCDFCPRAFHQDCIEAKAVDLQSDLPWACPACTREKDGLPSDNICGSKSLPVICAAYDDFQKEVDENCISNLRTMSIIHEMILELMDYDFGHIFRQPVNLELVPVYKNFVSEPMDLGTIASRLVNAKYHGRIIGGKGSFEDVILAALKDIELVWHNCFVFNCEGSAVYRMAEVLRRRAARIRLKSFDHYLSDKIKREVKFYTAQCEQHRREEANGNSRAPKLRAPMSDQSRHKVTVSNRNYNGRQVAVLDPESGRVVKFYSTVQAAIAAIDLFLQLKHPHEWDGLSNDVGQRARKIIKLSSSDPSALLFGYRWLFHEDLQRRRVVFDKEIPLSVGNAGTGTLQMSRLPGNRQNTSQSISSREILRMSHGGTVYSFVSLDEALSHSGLVGDLDLLRQSLIGLNLGKDFVDSSGRLWHRQLLKVNSDEPNNAVVNSAQFRSDSEAPCLRSERVAPNHRVVGVTPEGFQNLHEAFQDSLSVMSSTPISTKESQEAVETHFLNESLNLNGLDWKSGPTAPVDATRLEPLTSAVSNEATVADGQDFSAEPAKVSTSLQASNETTGITDSAQFDESLEKRSSPVRERIGSSFRSMLSPFVSHKKNGTKSLAEDKVPVPTPNSRSVK
jgi:Bromodomain